MSFDFQKLKDLSHAWQTGMQKNDDGNTLFYNCHDQSLHYHVLEYIVKFQLKCWQLPFISKEEHLIYHGEEIDMTNVYFTEIKQYRENYQLLSYFKRTRLI